MPLDHYISQVHLKNFYSPVLGQRMYAIRKSDMATYHCDSESQCRIENGSTNDYLLENRAIEEFLKPIESRYNNSVKRLHRGDIDDEVIYTIAGFVAYVMICSPASMRIYTKMLKGTLEATVDILDRQGSIPPPPPELGGGSLSEMLRTGVVGFKIDQKFPQAIGISGILKHIAAFGNFPWEILINENSDCPFVTSDYPIGIEQTFDPRILNRIIPLTPNLAIRILPNFDFDNDRFDFSFKHFRFRKMNVSRHQAVQLNGLIVKCAETTIYLRDAPARVRKFIEKNRYYRMDTRNTPFPTKNGMVQVSQQKIVSHQWS